jgi:hypothetical protein
MVIIGILEIRKTKSGMFLMMHYIQNPLLLIGVLVVGLLILLNQVLFV